MFYDYFCGNYFNLAEKRCNSSNATDGFIAQEMNNVIEELKLLMRCCYGCQLLLGNSNKNEFIVNSFA